MKKLILLSLLVLAACVIDNTHARAQGAFTLSIGPSFSSLQFATDGAISLYNQDGLDIGLAFPTSITASYVYDPFYSTALDSDFNLHGLLSAGAGAYGGYQLDDLKLYLALGYGALASTEPFTINLNQELIADDDLLDHLKSSLYARLGVNYQKFGLRLTSMSDWLQIFATYDLSEKIFAGVGYRRTLNGLGNFSSLGGGIPGLLKIDGAQASIGIKL